MVRAGLGDDWTCAFANDFDAKKVAVYERNWGEGVRFCDVRELKPRDLPGDADLAWASFPCQDLSLAGMGAGLAGDRSGTFWPFWNLLGRLGREGRGPSVVVVENVVGALTSHRGADFAAIIEAYASAGYQVGAIVMDAAAFVPQSRPRLFIVGIRGDVAVPNGVSSLGPEPVWHTRAVRNAYDRLPASLREAWVWWRLPHPPERSTTLADVIEADPKGVEWHDASENAALLDMMAPSHRARIDALAKAGGSHVGAVYKRTRRDEFGRKVQRAEVRFDGLAGCLRTPGGGSSRQFLVFVDDGRVRSRLISPRETARLMGLPDDYELPSGRNETYHLTGDGVAVPVAAWLSTHLLLPLAEAETMMLEAAE